MQLLNLPSAHCGLKGQPSRVGRPAAFSASLVPPPCHLLQRSSNNRTQARAAPGRLGNTSLFGDSGMSGMGEQAADTAAAAKPDLDSLPLQSEMGMDYSSLREHLKAGDFRKADDETRALLIRLAGEGAVKRDWVYWSEVKSIPDVDLQTLDALWKTASGGKFGYSVQKEVWLQNQKRWPKFFKQIDWVQGENNNYRKWPAEFDYSMNAKKGHLPLTNALRGTQLFTALLEHPAFEKKAGAGGKKTLDDINRENNARTSKLF